MAVVTGTSDDDLLEGTSGSDMLHGRDGDDELYGEGGDDELYGEGGDDLLFGGAGADALDGGNGDDIAAYIFSSAAVRVNLGAGTAAGGYAQGDTFVSIESLAGSNHDDVLTGDDGPNGLIGWAGADTLDGGAGLDTASYVGSDIAVTVNLATGEARGGHAQGDILSSIENLVGSDYDDVLTGDDGPNLLDGWDGDDTLEGGAGMDYLDGDEDEDTASYAGSDAAVTVNLATGEARGGHAEGDTLISIENLRGSSYADALTGDSWNNELEGGGDDDTLEGGAGADTLDGGAGLDTAGYLLSPGAVTVNLATGEARGGHAQGDNLISIENLTGSDRDDVLTGDSGPNVLEGGAGADTLDGGNGMDTASYADSSGRVLVRLHDARAVRFGDAQGDTLTNIEHLVGSEHNDILAGDGEDNRLEGRGGHDDLFGGPAGGDDEMLGGKGDDRIYGGRGNDTLTGGEGHDLLKGGPGDDVLIIDGDDMDVVNGGPGEDTFRFFPSDLGGGTIQDFTDGEDVIDLTAFTNINSMNDLDIVSHGDNVRIELSGAGYLTTIHLSDFDMNNLDSSDFLF